MYNHIVKYKVGKFPQRTRTVFGIKDGIKSENITALKYNDKGVLFVGTDKGLFKFCGEKFIPVELGIKTPYIGVVIFKNNEMYIGTNNSLIIFVKDKKIDEIQFNTRVVDVKFDGDDVIWILTENMIYKKIKGQNDFDFTMSVPGKGSCLTVYKDNRVYIGTESDGIHALVGKRWHWSGLDESMTGLISNNIRCIYTDTADNIWVGTDKGICIYDDKSLWLDGDTIDCLPKADVNDMDVDKNGDIYYATSTGLIHQHNGLLSYYGYKRWLPSPNATAVAVSDDGSVAVATDKGLSVIVTKYMTLEEKAKELRKLTETYNVKTDGYVLDRSLDHEGVVSFDEGYIPFTDNDGHRTGVYVADLCYEYACTKDEEIRKKAKRSLLAMIKLTEVTGLEGFTARAIRYPDDRDYGTGVRKEWHITKDKDGNELEWLGETSSDEMVGHFFCYANYYDLVADDEEKELIRGVVTKLLNHIIDNDFHLVDLDGKPTTWANWNPDLLNNDNKWIEEKGTNSLQMLAFLATGYHMTGNEKYKKVFNELAGDKHYAMNLMKYRIPDGHLCHIDDNHDFLMISLLMKYTTDPVLRSVFAMGLSYHWKDERAEKNAMYNLIYGVATGERFDAENVIEELVDYPMDHVTWSLYNSYRPDLKWDLSPMEQGLEPQLFEPLTPHERRIVNNDINRFIPDNGAGDVAKPLFLKSDKTNADNVLPPTGNDKGMELKTCNNYTLPYWYGRYYGLIEEN